MSGLQGSVLPVVFSTLKAVQASERVTQQLTALPAGKIWCKRSFGSHFFTLALCVSRVLEVTLDVETVVAGAVLIAEAIHRHAHISCHRVWKNITRDACLCSIWLSFYIHTYIYIFTEFLHLQFKAERYPSPTTEMKETKGMYIHTHIQYIYIHTQIYIKKSN